MHIIMCIVTITNTHICMQSVYYGTYTLHVHVVIFVWELLFLRNLTVVHLYTHDLLHIKVMLHRQYIVSYIVFTIYTIHNVSTVEYSTIYHDSESDSDKPLVVQ